MGNLRDFRLRVFDVPWPELTVFRGLRADLSKLLRMKPAQLVVTIIDKFSAKARRVTGRRSLIKGATGRYAVPRAMFGASAFSRPLRPCSFPILNDEGVTGGTVGREGETVAFMNPIDIQHNDRVERNKVAPAVVTPAYDQYVAPAAEVFHFCSLVLKHLRALVIGAIIGATIALVPLIWTPAEHMATTSFAPQGNDFQRNSLLAFAGQFGLPTAAPSLSQSPQFYADLVRSRVILEPFARDSLVVPEMNNRKVALQTLLDITEGSDQRRVDNLVQKMTKAIQTRVVVQTGVVVVTVSTPWRSVSLDVAQRLLSRVNTFDLKQRQTQGSNERRFVERRLAEAKQMLRNAEDRFETFLNSNHSIASAMLQMERDRFQRDLQLQQQVVTTLTQAYEDARIREIRDTPVISIIQPPVAPEQSESRHPLLRLVIGGLLGAFIVMLLAAGRDLVSRRRADGDADLEAFLAQVQGLRDRVSLKGSRRAAEIG